MNQSEEWIMIHAGCAECLDDPLMEPGGTFKSIDEAKASFGSPNVGKWMDHPNGGIYNQSGSGATWIVPLSALRVSSEESSGS